MGFPILSRNKRYLSGFDWVMGIIDCILKNRSSAGNIAQIVFTLDSRIEEAVFRDRLSKFIQLFPILKGKISRDFLNLAPYWKFSETNCENLLNFNVHHLEESPTGGDAISLMEKCINQSFESEKDHLAFHLIYTKNLPDYLLVTFDHVLFDARGAELFISLFQLYLSKDEDSSVTEGISYTCSPDLSEWKDKFDAGKKMNRKIIALSKTPMRSIPIPEQEEKKGFKFKLIYFDREQTKNIKNHAYDEAGYLMEMPYYLAIVTQTMHELFEKRKAPASSYLIPISIDKRSNKDTKQEIFFNYASLLFFQIGVDILNDRNALITLIKEQMYEQVQSRFSENIRKASTLLRIAPLTIMRKIFALPFGGILGSFFFAHVGKSAYQYSELMGVRIKNIFHMPRIPIPPGFGMIFNSFDEQLNVQITWLDGILSEGEVAMLESGLKRRLLEV